MNKIIKEHIDNFIDFIEKEKGYSEHTISSYKIDLYQFLKFSTDYFEGDNFDLKDMKRQLIREYLGYEFEKGKSVKTRYRKLASVKSFFKYMIREKNVVDSPAEYIPMPKLAKKIPRFIQQGQNIDQLMSKPKIFEETKSQQAKNSNKKRDNTKIRQEKILRDCAMLELFYASGIRRSELVSLNIGSVNISERLLKVSGKGKKDRIVPFNRSAEDALTVYINFRGKIWDKDLTSPLFCGSNQRRISVRTVSRRIGDYIKDLNINNSELGPKLGEGGPHTLRHTFGSHLIDGEADIRVIQELLGHSSISSTQIYTNVSSKKIKKVYKKAHPRGQ